MTLKHRGNESATNFQTFTLLFTETISEAQGCQKIAKTVHAFLPVSVFSKKEDIAFHGHH